jgi:hypothetical protein
MQRRSGIARLPLSVMARKATTKTDSTAALGFEAKLWLAADDLRNNMDAAVTKRSDKRRLQSALAALKKSLPHQAFTGEL